MSMAVDLRTFQYRTDFTASQPRMLNPWDNTPFALATPTPGHRAIERLCRANGHFSRLNSLVSGLEIDMSLADATVVSGDLVWAVPLRVVQPLDCSHPGVMETEAPQPLSSRRQRAIEAIDQIRRLCDVSDERAADLMGVARGTLRSWRAGSREPYPATTRHLFEVESVISALVRSMGPEAARDWLLERGPRGNSRSP